MTSEATQISFYDDCKGSYELSGRLQMPRSRGIPTALATVAVDAPTDAAKERLLFGDSAGGIMMLHSGEGQRSLPLKQLEMEAIGDAVPCGHTAQITQAKQPPAVTVCATHCCQGSLYSLPPAHKPSSM